VPEISKTADQALAVLLELGDNGPLTPAALSRSLGINRTVVHRLLATLHGKGFVTRQENGYAPGPVLLRIAQRAQPELRAAARKVLTELGESVGETVVLHIPDGDDAVVLDQVVSQHHVLRAEHEIGSRHPLEKGASGRALLAYLPESTIDRIAAHSEFPDALRRELESVQSVGYAISHDELQHGVHGLAVPVLDRPEHVQASLAILTPTMRAVRLVEKQEELRAAADRIGASLAMDDGANARGAGA
jgi:IclR family KDG regulon transcriptional repressor